MKCGLVGKKLGYSFSQEIHQKLGRYTYDLFELDEEGLKDFLEERSFGGINVTIPYKQTVIPYLDSISRRAERIGAVNTIVNRNGRLFGDNTDYGGMEALIRKTGIELTGKTVLIAGTGGTSRTAYAVAEDLGASRILKAGRTGKDGSLTYEEAYRTVPDAQILINTTPVGTDPDIDRIPVDLDRLPSLEGIVDVVYNPLSTRLVREGRKRRIRSEGGLYMLTAQAVIAAEAFTGEAFGTEVIDRIYREILSEKRNIVLIGMPGSGKSTVGRILSERLGRMFLDTDAEIEKQEGTAIADIFRTFGEPAFRDMESLVIRSLSGAGGRILSTGGGAVLREANTDWLRANGILVFLDRSPDCLRPSGKRPLADTEDKILKLYRDRLPIYKAAADLTVTVYGSPGRTADKVIELLGQKE